MGAKAEIPNKPQVRERILPEERIDLFDQREKRCVQIVIVVGEVRVEKAGIDVADCDELEGGMGRKKDVRGDPIRRFPMPLSVRGANELSKIWTPISERDGCHLAGVS